MIRYRPQRGTLVDAMKEYKEFNTLGEMFEYIASTTPLPQGISNLSISEDYGCDSRIGWKHSHYVLTTAFGTTTNYDNPQAIGYCSIEE